MKDLVNKVHQMDCIEFMKLLPDSSIHSCVTDPPYGLEFMGKEWDNLKNMQEWHYQWALEVYRVLKPGAHILAFSGARTYHRLACAIEDAGFEIRDQIHWVYGSGFPKGLNVSFGIMQKQLYEWLEDYPEKREKLRNYKGTERRRYMIELMVEADIAEVLDRAPLPWNERKQYTDIRGRRFHRADGEHKHTSYQYIMPKTPEAREWTGYNSQLKPAHEPIVLARKPILESSIIDNVLKHGTGALNIDATRVSVNPELDAIGRTTTREKRQEGVWEKYSGFINPKNPNAGVLPSGRYPANLILSHHEDCKLIKKGTTRVWSRNREVKQHMGSHGIYGNGKRAPVEVEFDSKSDPEIWNCVEGCPIRILNEQSGDVGGRWGKIGSVENATTYFGNVSATPPDKSYIGDTKGGAARFFYCPKPSESERNTGLMGDRNIHITVKPLAIMRWLVRLVTPPCGVVLDPFLGSGTTAIAAENEGFDWVGCEISEEYSEIAKLRIKALGGRQSTLDDFQ